MRQDWPKLWKDLESQSFKWFFVLFFVMSAVGLLLGGLLDAGISKWQQVYEQQLYVRILFFVAQLFITVCIFFTINKFIPAFDNWLFQSYGGFIFIFFYFLAQTNLEKNVRSFFQF